MIRITPKHPLVPPYTQTQKQRQQQQQQQDFPKVILFTLKITYIKQFPLLWRLILSGNNLKLMLEK